MRPCYLAQLFSQLCWNTGYFAYQASSEMVARIFSSWHDSTCGTASKRESGPVWRVRNVNVFSPGDTLSVGICVLENLTVKSPWNYSSFFVFSFLEHLLGESFPSESPYFGALLPGISEQGLKKRKWIVWLKSIIDKDIRSCYVIFSYFVA